MATGASEDEIADVLLAIATVAGLGRVVSDVATALGMTCGCVGGPGRSLTAPQLVMSVCQRWDAAWIAGVWLEQQAPGTS